MIAQTQTAANPVPDVHAPDLSGAERMVERQRKLRTILQQRQTADYFFMIDIVGTCNLRCPSCAVGNYPQTAATGLMSLDTYRAILNKINKEHDRERS